MTCETALKLMSAALDGELTAAEKVELDRHLAQCESCRALFAELSAIHDACGGLDAAPPPALREQILTHLPPQEAPAPKKKGKVIPIHWKRWSAMAAAFVLVSFAAWQLPKTLSQPPRGASEVQADLPQVPKSDPAKDAMEEIAASEATPLADAAFDSDSTDNGPAASAAPYAPATADDAPAESSAFGKTSKVFTGNQDTSAAATAGVLRGIGTDKEDTLSLSTNDAADMEFGSEQPSMLYSSARVAATFAPKAMMNDEADGAIASDFSAAGDASAAPAADAYDEVPETYPDVPAEENVRANLLTGYAAGAYCGVLTLEGDGSLLDYSPTAVYENGESWYTLPRDAFDSLVEELTDAGVAFDLRATGDDISALAEYGLVIIHP